MVGRCKALQGLLALFFFQEALVVFVDVVEEGEAELRRGSYPSQCKMRLDFGRLRQLLDCLRPIVLPPGIPGAQRGYEAVGKAVVAYAGASLFLRELSLGLPKQALIVGYEALYFGLQFTGMQKVQGDIQFATAALHLFLHVLQAKTHRSVPSNLRV